MALLMESDGAALLGEKGKDAVIRRENKTKRRKKKAALDGGKGSE